MEWMRDCFEPETKHRLRGDYRMLIVDGHASHVLTEFIQFAREHKIVCLCLPAHSTHLLQPLDIGVFGPLKQNYKTLLVEKTRFTTYNIDKADFISLIQKARQQGITSRNIQSAWRATGLIPYNPSVVFDKISTSHTERDTLPSTSTPIRTRFFWVKYHQHRGILNRWKRWKSLYRCFAIRLLTLLNSPSYIKPSKQLGLQW